MYFKLEKPDLDTVKAERIYALLERDDIRSLITNSLTDYRYWDKARYQPWPKNVSPEEGWAAIKFVRFQALAPFRTDSVVVDQQGRPFSLLKGLPWFEDLLHRIDMGLGGALRADKGDMLERESGKLIARGVMEEAIASSQLEGAHVTRKDAKRMLREGRKPQNRNERMILNNYHAMQHIEQQMKREHLSLDSLFKLHAILTEGTLENPANVGTFRDDEGAAEHERVAVRNDSAGDDTIYHMPPQASFMRTELDRLIAYANDDAKVQDIGFVHPVYKAIIIHFWIGYLHPFADGNGRIARALFYWYLLRKGYWGFAFLPLSVAIRKSPGQYGMAYIYTEQDDNDLTYFIAYNLQKIEQALQEFETYSRESGKENSETLRKAREIYGLNARQIELVRFFVQKPNESTTTTIYLKINNISRPTAINDLENLHEKGLLLVKKIGREKHYLGTKKLLAEFS